MLKTTPKGATPEAGCMVGENEGRFAEGLCTVVEGLRTGLPDFFADITPFLSLIPFKLSVVILQEPKKKKKMAVKNGVGRTGHPQLNRFQV